MLWQHVRNDCRDNYRNKSRFQRMASSLRYSTIGLKRPSALVLLRNELAQRAIALAFYTQRECTELRSVLTAILPLQTMRWVPHYPHFSSLLFSTKIDGSISICAKLISNFADAKHYRG
jgi:hypothetical protein